VPGSSIIVYDVRYRFRQGVWYHWLTTPENSAVFSIPHPDDGLYDFEVRATNTLGQTEPFTGIPEASIIVDRNAPFVVPQSYFALVTGGSGQ
jgi:hypothetical protein